MQDKPVRPIVSGGIPRRARIPLHRAERWLTDGENSRGSDIKVFVTQTAFKAINNHANTDLDNEVGGWLAGRWCRDIDTKAEYVVVEALLPAQQVRSGSTFLTFTHDSQVAMLAALEERYAKKGIVGWYHTHPRMGLFLSGYDTWLHDHFFPHPWQVALVVEPHSHIGGFFIRNKKQELDTRRCFGFYELHNRKHESIVDWNNLHPEKIEEKKVEKSEQRTVLVSKQPENKELPQRQKISVPGAEKTVKKSQPPNPIRRVDEASLEAKPDEIKQLPATVDSSKKESNSVAKKPKSLVSVEEKTTEPRQPILRKFEGMKPPAKVSLLNKEEKKIESEDDTNTSKE